MISCYEGKLVNPAHFKSPYNRLLNSSGAIAGTFTANCYGLELCDGVNDDDFATCNCLNGSSIEFKHNMSTAYSKILSIHAIPGHDNGSNSIIYDNEDAKIKYLCSESSNDECP